LGAASAAALACLSTVAHAVPYILGGGSTLAQFDYIAEFSTFNASKPTATFSTYWESGSGTGQAAFIGDDLCTDINKVQGGTSCTKAAGATGNTVMYGASDATLSGAQISTWATSSFGQSAAGDLIQVPSMGVGVSIPVVNSAVTANGTVVLSDNDLCQIFSAGYTNFSQITDNGNKLTGAFNVAYRSDGSGTSFILTNHLNAVCNSGNTAAGVTFTATTSFASLFATLPPNFVGQSGSNGVASYLAGCSASGTVANALGYLSPDFTTIDPSSGAQISCANGTKETSPLVVAGVQIDNKGAGVLPTVKNIQTALDHVVLGSNVSPPTNATAAANPALWVPGVQTVSSGYPISGYTTFDFAQCYVNASVNKNIQTFLADHYRNATYAKIQNNNGFVTLEQTKANTFETAISENLLANTNGWNVNIGNATACAGKHGR
jgi:ABC-type phosphate transport system substrate-binding protein